MKEKSNASISNTTSVLRRILTNCGKQVSLILCLFWGVGGGGGLYPLYN